MKPIQPTTGWMIVFAGAVLSLLCCSSVKPSPPPVEPAPHLQPGDMELFDIIWPRDLVPIYTPPVEKQMPPPEPRYLIHTVTKPGETLIGIARWYTGNASNWYRLNQLNHTIDPRRMPIGATIRIPEKLLVTIKPMPATAIPKPTPKALPRAPKPPDSSMAPPLFNPIENMSPPATNGKDELPRPLQRLEDIDEDKND